MWQGSSVQVAIDASGHLGAADKTNTYFELGFALEQDGRVATHAWTGNFDWSTVTARGERNPKGYRLRIAIPWRNLSLDSTNLPESLGINIVINGKTASGQRRFVEWTPGTATEKNPKAFARAILRPLDEKSPAWIFLDRESYDDDDRVEGIFVEYAASSRPAGDFQFSLNTKAGKPLHELPSEKLDALPRGTSRAIRFTVPATEFSSEGEYLLTVKERSKQRPLATAMFVRADFQERVTAGLEAASQRLDNLRQNLSTRPEFARDPYLCMAQLVVERFLDRIPRDTLESAQSRDWRLLQLREIEDVLQAAEKRLLGPAFSAPRPAADTVTLKNGRFLAQSAGAAPGSPDRPFYLYGYGHFNSVLSDLPLLAQLGVTLIQQDHGMREMQPDGTLAGGAQPVVSRLERAANDGALVDLLLSPHYLPQWLLDDPPPDFLVRNATGIITYNIDHPAARKLISDYLRAFVPALNNAKGLLSISLANEPTYTGSGRDEYSRPIWIQYLQEKHGSISSLNELYGTSYASFNEVPVPATGMPDSLELRRAYYDWIIFNQTHFANWHRWMNDLVKAGSPSTPTSVKIMANIFDRETLSRGIDPERICEITDIAGNDCWAYPGPVNGFAYDWQLEEMWYDLLHSFRGQAVFDSENHLIRDNSPPLSISPQSTHCVLWQGALHHQSATTIWIWEEPNHNDLRGSIFLRPANIYAAGKAMLDLNRLAPEVAAVSREKSEIAILYSVTSIFWQEDYPKALSSVYRALVFGGKPVTFISEHQLSTGARSSANDAIRCIVLPRATHVKAGTVKALAEFQQKGGIVVPIGEDNLAYDDYSRRFNEKWDLSLSPVSWQSAKEKEFPATLYSRLKERGIEARSLSDPSGNPLTGVEFRTTTLDGRELIAMTNLLTREQVAQWPAGGQFVDLLDGSTVDAQGIVLKPMEPRLLEVKK